MRPRTGERGEDIAFGYSVILYTYISSNDLCPHSHDDLPKCSLLTLLEEVHLLQSLKVNVHANLRLELVWQGVEGMLLVHLVAVGPQVVKPFDDSVLGRGEGRQSQGV